MSKVSDRQAAVADADARKVEMADHQFETILIEKSDAVMTIRLNRPTAGNALNSQMRRELAAAIFAADRKIRVIVLTGVGDAFCSGQDLGAADRFRALDLESTLLDETSVLIHRIADCPAPVICAVNGLAAGAGANLALACDIVLAARSAQFVQSNILAGMIPDTGATWTLPNRIGLARAMAIALTAEPVLAETAAEWGMIWRAVPDNALENQAARLAQQLARGPAAAIAATKQALRAGAVGSLTDQLAHEAAVQGKLAGTADFAEGVSAVLEGRASEFNAV